MEARPAMDHTSRWKPALLWTTHLDGGPPYYGPHVLVEARPAMDHTPRWRPSPLRTTFGGVKACYGQPLQNHPSGHLGGRATPWLASEMLDGQHQRVDIPAHARAAYSGVLQKTLEENLC